MSVDNWAVCPRCVKRAQAELDRLTAEVEANYGKIPAADYASARDALRPINPERFQTFREDYEICGAETGSITVDYGGACQVCDLWLSFTDVREIPGVSS